MCTDWGSGGSGNRTEPKENAKDHQETVGFQALALLCRVEQIGLSGSMPAKRAGAHSGHVAAKRAKQAREAALLDAAEDDVNFRDGCKELMKQLKEDPDGAKKLRRCQQAIKAEVYVPEDSTTLPSDLRGRNVKRLPVKFLKDEWMPIVAKFEGAPQQLLDAKVRNAIMKKDKQACHKLLCRLHIISEMDHLGPLLKQAWFNAYSKRLKEVGGWPTELVLSPDYEFDFTSGGHFKLIPVKPQHVAAEEWKYAGFSFIGKDVTFVGPLKDSITGSWRLSKNWDHQLAFVGNPLHPRFDTTCREFLMLAAQELVAPIQFEPEDPPLKILDATPSISKEAGTSSTGTLATGSPATKQRCDDDVESTMSRSSSGVITIEKTPPPRSALGSAVAGGHVVSVAGLGGKMSEKKKRALKMLENLVVTKPEEKDADVPAASVTTRQTSSALGASASAAATPEHENMVAESDG